MPACARCGGRICKGETACFNCQMPVVEEKSRAQVNLGRFRILLDIMFYGCLALTAASLFFDFGFRTAMTAAASLVLRLVRISASEMSESKG